MSRIASIFQNATRKAQNEQNAACGASGGLPEVSERVSQPNARLVGETLVNVLYWMEQERAAAEVARRDIPFVDGGLDFSEYDAAMEKIREARAGLAAELRG